MRKLLPALMMLAGGCAQQGWSDVPTATVTPVGSPSFERAVKDAVKEWDGLLSACDQKPFEIGRDGHVVKEVDPMTYVDRYGEDVWGMEWDDGGFKGIQYVTNGWIEIKGGLPPWVTRLVLMHELGHAMGLGHVAVEDGPSIMTERVGSEVYPMDIQDAAEVIGCTP